MPKGRVQFEIGIQSTNLKTLGQISRANPWEEMTNNIKSIMAYGNIHLHVDLIIGLPYEDITSFANLLMMYIYCKLICFKWAF